MKQLTRVLWLSLMVAGTACTQDTLSPEEGATLQREGLVGKWRLTSYYQSIGGPGEWFPASGQTAKTIEIRADGTFYNSADGTSRRYTYSAQDSVLTLSPISNRGQDRYFVRKITADSLQLDYMWCFEGCSEKFVSVK